jgi:P-type E1-E2 ATPase
MPCDAVLIQGEAYMNEHSLTGESVPVGKFRVSHLQSDEFPENSVLF